MLLLLARCILFVGGWQIVGQPPAIKKYVLIGGPHTSNWDFVYAISAKIVLRLELRYLGKAALFKPPFGWIFRGLGGYPVERTTSRQIVDYAAGLFEQEDEFILGLAPEGTCSKVDNLRSGFYHIAKRAGVPVVMIGLDYARREFRFGEVFWPGDDMEADMQKVKAFFAESVGKYPEKGISL